MNERANLVDKSVGDERVSVDKIKNHQEMNHASSGKNCSRISSRKATEYEKEEI